MAASPRMMVTNNNNKKSAAAAPKVGGLKSALKNKHSPVKRRQTWRADLVTVHQITPRSKTIQQDEIIRRTSTAPTSSCRSTSAPATQQNNNIERDTTTTTTATATATKKKQIPIFRCFQRTVSSSSLEL
mmetsp:Transcript_7857/g.20301  ORF Transcript_7857/g.20301 Transcript_7857/m.20301 type:complete len:130 (-) Transcript_7857:101-490(-)